MRLAGVFEAVTASLLQAYTYQTCPGELLQSLKNLNAEILRRRYPFAKSIHVFVQIHMIEWLDNLASHVTIEIGKIGNHPRGPINRSGYGNLHHVVVPMPIRVIALAVDSLVFGFIPLRAVQTMRSRQLVAPRQLQPHAAPSP